MAYLTNIADPKIEKHSLVVLRPRYRHTGFTNVSGVIWSTPITRGRVTRVWNSFANDEGFTEIGTNTPALNEFYYDSSASVLYVGFSVDPDSNTYAGLTVEFELNLSSDQHTGPRDPMDNTSDVVDWIPCLRDIPSTVNGSAESLYGVFPVALGSLRLINVDGVFNELLHNSTFNLAPVKAYILANRSLEDGTASGDVRQVFTGFSKNIEFDLENISIQCTDYLSILNRNYYIEDKYQIADFPNVQLEAVETGAQWYIRHVHGMVDSLHPVNISYNASPSTSNNRTWITHIENGTPGALLQTVDHLAANTGTRTYFTSKPLYNIGDWIRLTNNGSFYYVEVEAVNRSLNYIDHEPLVRTIAAGDVALRLAIARVVIEDEDGQGWWLRPVIDYNVYSQGLLSGNTAYGITMANNWEAAIGFTHTPFDPSKHKIYCRVYGTVDLQKYSDGITDVGTVVDNGGINAGSLPLLFKFITHSGFSVDDIDDVTFQDLEGSSHSLGIAIPEARDGQETQKYSDIINSILGSMMWRLAFTEYSYGLRLGVVATQPFQAAANTNATESEIKSITYKHDYADVYSDVVVNFGIKENATALIGTGSGGAGSAWDLASGICVASNDTANDLHFVSKAYTLNTLHYDLLQAQTVADRFAFALSDRRGYYEISLGQEFLNVSNLGTYYNIYMQMLPGFDFVYGTENTRQVVIVEVQKSSQGVTLTLEDQKAIQDNSGAWPYF